MLGRRNNSRRPFFCFGAVESSLLRNPFASLLVLSDTTRLDIYNTGAKENKIELIGRTEKVYPDWCKNDNGSCVVAEVRNYWFWLKKKVLVIPPVGRPKWSALCPRFWRIQDCASQRQSSNFRACSNLAEVL